jgi:hypothetical protein
MLRTISGILSRVLSMPMIVWVITPHTAVSVISNLIKINCTSPASVRNVIVRGYRDLCSISNRNPEPGRRSEVQINSVYPTVCLAGLSCLVSRRIKCNVALQRSLAYQAYPLLRLSPRTMSSPYEICPSSVSAKGKCT